MALRKRGKLFKFASERGGYPERRGGSLQKEGSVRNLSWQLANAEAFAEAYVHFIVFALARKIHRQLNY